MTAITMVQDILYAITGIGIAVTIWYVIPRPWRRNGW
jgi:hypothetical protein